MARRRRSRPERSPRWSRRRLRILVVASGFAVVVLVVAAVLGLVRAVQPAQRAADADVASTVAAAPATPSDPRDQLAAAPMPSVDQAAAHPGPVSQHDPGPSIALPGATSIGPAGVPTGFPQTPEGALAQLAAIDQTAVQSGSLAGARDVIRAWAMPGGPTPTSWSVARAVGTLLEGAGLSGGGSDQLAVVLTPLMGLIKGTVGTGFVVPCVDFELDVTLEQTARGAVADCQRMVWQAGRWLIGPGAEPATPPSIWPDTDLAISVGYQDLRRG